MSTKLESQKKQKTGIARLFEMMQEKKSILIISTIMSALSACCQCVPFIATWFVVKAFLFDNLNQAELYDYVWFWGCVACLGVTIAMLLSGCAFVFSHIAAFRILHNLRLAISGHLAKLPFGFFVNTSSGTIKQIFAEDVPMVELFIAHKVPEFVMTITASILIIGIFFYVDFRMALISIVVYILAFAIQFHIYSDSSMKNEVVEFSKDRARIYSSATEFVRGIAVLKMFASSASSFQGFKDNVNLYRAHALTFANKASRGYILFTVLINFSMFFVYPLVWYLYSVDDVASNNELIVNAILFTLLSNALLPLFFKIMTLAGTMMTINEGVEHINSLLSEKTLTTFEPIEKPKNGDIEFQNVCFTYDNNLEDINLNPNLSSKNSINDNLNEKKDFPKNIINNISFKVKAGESLALVGASGSGKSTILSLAARFFDVSSGKVLIGDADISHMTEQELMKNVSIVLQKSFMFQDTIRANIMGEITNATDADILKAAHLAGCDEIISRLGLDYVIGAEGNSLSGGEMQRINIARAILKDSPILLLDEVSSALDPQNQLLITQALEKLKERRTQIIVAHRLDSIINCDHIAIIDKGTIVAYGTHQELLEQNQYYQDLWQLYQESNSWKLINDSQNSQGR